MEYIIRVKL